MYIYIYICHQSQRQLGLSFFCFSTIAWAQYDCGECCGGSQARGGRGSALILSQQTGCMCRGGKWGGVSLDTFTGKGMASGEEGGDSC